MSIPKQKQTHRNKLVITSGEREVRIWDWETQITTYKINKQQGYIV